MGSTYRAVEVATPGVLRVVERPISKPAAGQVRLRVEACGVCHSDLATVQGDYPGLKLPRVPGHEVVGRIEEIGPNVSKWKIGQRVGVGFLGGQDGECEPCLRGDFANCLNPVISGITTDGGYAEVMIAEARALASIPDELTAEAAPLLCAGITTFNALRNAGLRAGDLVGVQGIGALDTWAFNLPGAWGSAPWPSITDRKRKSWPKSWARIPIWILQQKMSLPLYRRWAVPERSWRPRQAAKQLPHWSRASQFAAS